jgi:uncharacterized protein
LRRRRSSRRARDRAGGVTLGGMYGGPIIDIHAHIAFSDEQKLTQHHSVGAAAFRAAVQVDGVVKAGAIVMAGKGDLEGTRARNDAVLAAAGDFIVPVVSVHPHDGHDALSELDRVAALGAKILKLHPNTQGFDVADERVPTLVARAGEHDMTVLFDAVNPFDPAQPGKFLKLAGTCPTRLILAHFHGMDFLYAMAYGLVREFPWWQGNVYHDISWIGQAFAGSPFQEQFVWVVRQVGLDRVLYGSDWPQRDPAESLAAARSLGLTDAEQEQLFYGTAAELLRL